MITLTGYSAYFDASLDELPDEKATVVAGWVSTVELWEYWEAAWRIALAKFDVPYFHMKEFGGFNGPFSGPKWRNEAHRAEFVTMLVGIVKDYTLASIGSLTKQSVFDRQNQFFELDQRYNPYALSGRDCAVRVRAFIRENLASDLPIAFIFERGDIGWGKLVTEMEASGLPSPIHKHARPDPKIDDPPAIQLQACDLLAWEIRRGKQDARIKGKLRKSLLSLSEVPNRLWFESKDEDVVRLIRLAGIQLRPAWKHLEESERLKGWNLEKRKS